MLDLIGFGGIGNVEYPILNEWDNRHASSSSIVIHGALILESAYHIL